MKSVKKFKCKYCDVDYPHVHASKECKLFDICLDKACLRAPFWSKEICYALYKLMKQGLVKSNKKLWKHMRRKI